MCPETGTDNAARSDDGYIEENKQFYLDRMSDFLDKPRSRPIGGKPVRNTRGDLFVCHALLPSRDGRMDKQKSAEGIVAFDAQR